MLIKKRPYRFEYFKKLTLLTISLSVGFIACDSSQETSNTTANPMSATDTATQAGAQAGTVNDEPVIREVIEVEGVPYVRLAEVSRCEDTQGDEELFTCVEEQFWRVFQRDIEQRRDTITWMSDIEDRIVGAYKMWSAEEILGLDGMAPDLTVLQKKYARMIFQRAQLITAYTSEEQSVQQDLTLIAQMQSDYEKSLRLHPGQPFYQIWLDAVLIGVACLLQRFEALDDALTQGWLNLDTYTEDTTRSTLVASLVGTASAMPMNTEAPEIAANLVRNWDCNPEVLEANPDRICGAHDMKVPCVEWCRTNSIAAPFKAPGLAYHDGEMLARVGDMDGARQMYELAKTMPGFKDWPYRYFVDDALADMETHISKFTSLADNEPAFNVAYMTSVAACSLCHVAPNRIVSK